MFDNNLTQQESLQLLIRARNQIKILQQDNTYLRMHIELLQKQNQTLLQNLHQKQQQIINVKQEKGYVIQDLNEILQKYQKILKLNEKLTEKGNFVHPTVVQFQKQQTKQYLTLKTNASNQHRKHSQSSYFHRQRLQSPQIKKNILKTENYQNLTPLKQNKLLMSPQLKTYNYTQRTNQISISTNSKKITL